AQGLREPHRAVAAHDECHRIRILRPEERRERARLRLRPMRVELVQADKRRAAKLTPPFLEDRGRERNLRTIDEDRLPVAAEQPFSRRGPFRIGDLDEIAEHPRRHPALPELAAKILSDGRKMRAGLTGRMLANPVAQAVAPLTLLGG